MEHLEGDQSDFVVCDTLDKAQRDLLKIREEKTSKIYFYRIKIANFYRKYRGYLPKEEYVDKNGEKKERRLHLEDINERLNNEVVRSKEELLESIIDWSGGKKLFDSKKSNESRLDDDLESPEVDRDDVMLSFDLATKVQEELTRLESDRTSDEYYRQRYGSLIESKVKVDKIIVEIGELEKKEDGLVGRGLGTFDQEKLITIRRKYKKEGEKLEGELKTLLSENREAYLYYYFSRVKEMQDALERDGVIETPYVKDVIEEVVSSIRLNKPVFLHGELGSGKTVLAKHIARRYVSDKYIEEEMVGWEKKNPKPKVVEEIIEVMVGKEKEKVKRITSESKAKIDDWNREMLKHRMEVVLAREPLILSGSRDITLDEIIGTRSVKREEPKKPILQVNEIEDEWKTYIKEHPDAKTDEVLKESFFKIYQEYFEQPVLVTVILGPVLQAMKEGRPLIIDEINAIPHGVLVKLNDYLTLTPGSLVTVTIPGSQGQQIRVKEGFCVLATGNLNRDEDPIYVGRQPICPAFKSRFTVRRYDYLPNNRDSEAAKLSKAETLSDDKYLEMQRNFRRENELFQILMVKLLNDDLSASLPNDVFEKVGQLARVARVLQDAFSNVGESETLDTAVVPRVNGSEVRIRDVYKENVLSIRHLMTILDHWRNDGFTKSLDFYIFDKYLARSDGDPKEKQYLYKVFKVIGGFFGGVNESAWPKEDEILSILNFNVDKVPDESKELKNFTQVEVIELLFGSQPKLKKVNKKLILKEEVSKNEKGKEKEVGVATVLFRSRIRTLLYATSLKVGERFSRFNYQSFLNEQKCNSFKEFMHIIEGSAGGFNRNQEIMALGEVGFKSLVESLIQEINNRKKI